MCLDPKQGKISQYLHGKRMLFQDDHSHQVGRFQDLDIQDEVQSYHGNQQMKHQPKKSFLIPLPSNSGKNKE